MSNLKIVVIVFHSFLSLWLNICFSILIWIEVEILKFIK